MFDSDPGRPVNLEHSILSHQSECYIIIHCLLMLLLDSVCGSGSCPLVDFGFSCVEPLGSVT